VNHAKSAVDVSDTGVMPSRVFNAMLIFDALITSGIRYVPDPNNPYYDINSHQAIDNLKYPRETLLQSAGDCDDLSVLYCSLLEALGIKTKLIDVPKHLFMMFDTEIPEEQGYKIHSDKLMYAVIDKTIWIPVEVTKLDAGFMEAWQAAARKYRRWATN
jgi:hypothetical protein